MLKQFRTLILIAAVACLGVSISGGTSYAETYNEAVARLGAQLRSQNPDERASAIEQIAMTGEVNAATLVMDTMARETDGLAARQMGRSLRHIKEARAIGVIDRRIRTWNTQATAFHLLWALTGVAEAQTEEGDAIVTKIVAESRNNHYHIKAAGLEAIGESGRTNLYHLVADILKEHVKDWDGNGLIVPITAASAAARIGTGEARFPLVEALAATLKNYENDRIRYFASQAAGRITGQPAYQEHWYWEEWVKMEGKVGDERKPSRTDQRNRPKFFGTEVLGSRVIFVIDNSGSMNAPIRIAQPPADEKPPEPKGEVTGRGGRRGKGEVKEPPAPPDYSKVQTRMDLAKVELIYTLEQLDENYEFNIIYYATEHDYLINSRKAFYKATDANKKAFIDKVRELPVAGATNIHGAMMRAFRTSTRGEIRGDPALDPAVLANGADTIFFLTDGIANWSDTSSAGDARTGGQPTRDKYTESRNIADDVRRVNTFRRTVIHTVGIGTHDGALMRTLADQSGGTYKDMTGVGRGGE
jgi:Mg-chelatase subunit ChlD